MTAPEHISLRSSGIRPVWLASYPRSGNTFLRIIMQNMFLLPSYSIYRIEGQEFHDASADALGEAPYLPRDWFDLLSDAPTARTVVIKTHSPPRGSGSAIFLVRDGRASIDSYYHYHKKFAFEQPSLTEVIAGACQFGSWSDHYLAWQPKTRPRTLFLRYEDLVSRPTDFIPILAKFLGTEPVDGQLPTFAELKERLPAFFRRGQNSDFLMEWTPGQVALFNELHGPVMEELGYTTSVPRESPVSTVAELARSAARSHKLYLEQLQKEGTSAAVRDEFSREIARLSNKLKEISEKAADKDRMLDPLLRSHWVKLGMAVGAVKPARNGNGKKPV